MKRQLMYAAVSAGLSLGAFAASAASLDLTNGGSGYRGADASNLALFQTTAVQPAGTGVIDPFLRLQGNGVVEGYNTDSGNNALDPNNKQILTGWTNSIKLSTLATVSVGGTDYYQFLLDINQLDNKPLLDLNAVKIFQTTTGTPTGFNGTTFPGATLVYDLGTGNTVNLKYDLPGSGVADLFMYVKKSAFDQNGPQYVTFYSRFGEDPNPDNDGFEEWAAFTSTTNKPPGGDPDLTPLPSAALSGMSLLGCLGIARRRSR